VSVCLNSIAFVITSVQVYQHTPTQNSNITVCIQHKTVRIVVKFSSIKVLLNSTEANYKTNTKY